MDLYGWKEDSLNKVYRDQAYKRFIERPYDTFFFIESYCLRCPDQLQKAQLRVGKFWITVYVKSTSYFFNGSRNLVVGRNKSSFSLMARPLTPPSLS